MAYVLVPWGCYHRIPQTGWLTSNRNVFPTVLEAGRLLADLGVHMVGEVRKLSEVCFIKTLIPFMRAPPS